jgi:hypothetical protein
VLSRHKEILSQRHHTSALNTAHLAGAGTTQPHRIQTFKRSRDPGFAAKLTHIVDLYVDLPLHAVVLSLDEKSPIQALVRTQPGLPIKPGRCQTMTHDYKRHGTTTLFAALSVLDGTVIGRGMQRHRDSEFIRFLNAVEREVPAVGFSGASSALAPPLHPDLRLLVQRGRKLLLRDDSPAHPSRRLSLDRRSADRHQSISGRA